MPFVLSSLPPQAVQVIFDPKKIDLVDLVRWFWEAWCTECVCAAVVSSREAVSGEVARGT